MDTNDLNHHQSPIPTLWHIDLVLRIMVYMVGVIKIAWKEGFSRYSLIGHQVFFVTLSSEVRALVTIRHVLAFLVIALLCCGLVAAPILWGKAILGRIFFCFLRVFFGEARMAAVADGGAAQKGDMLPTKMEVFQHYQYLTEFKNKSREWHSGLLSHSYFCHHGDSKIHRTTDIAHFFGFLTSW